MNHFQDIIYKKNIRPHIHLILLLSNYYTTISFQHIQTVEMFIQHASTQTNIFFLLIVLIPDTVLEVVPQISIVPFTTLYSVHSEKAFCYSSTRNQITFNNSLFNTNVYLGHAKIYIFEYIFW